MPNGEIQAVLGERLRSYRLQRNVRIEDLARSAGIGTATVKAAERGDDVRVSSLIKILRAFDRLDALEAFLLPPTLSPIAMSKLQGKTRQRARKSRDG